MTCQDSNCVSCAPTSDVCTTCREGYFANDAGQCEACTESCLSCDSADTCSLCENGYVPVESDGITFCGQCLSSCGVCDSTDLGNCLRCNKGFYLQEGSCEICPDGCTRCNSA